MSNSIHYYLSWVTRIVLISVFILVALLLSHCGKEPATGITDTPDTLDVKDTVRLVATPSVGSISLSWNFNDSLTYVLYWSENPGVSQASTKIMNITSPYTFEGLKDNHTYYYRLGIIDGEKVINLSDEVKVTTRQINVVTDKPVLYASGGDQRVVLFWDNLAEPANCTVYWSKNSGFTIGNCEKMTVHQNPYVHTSLLNDITYYYRIAVEDADGQVSDLSEQVEAYTHATTEIPTFPTNVKVQERNTMLTISWTPDGSADFYYIYWAKSSGVDKNCSKEKSMTNILHFSNLENGTKYYIRISAVNSQGEGQLSKEVSGTPKPLEPPQMQAVPGYDVIDLKWSTVSNANSYTLICSSSNAGRPDTFNNVHSPFTHDNPVPGVDYTYSIVSVNLDGQSTPCRITASSVGLVAPNRPSADTTGYGTITLIWSPVKYANSYIFYWDDTVVVAATAHKIDVGSLTSYTHSGLIPQKEYRYRVQAVKGNDSSALSPEYTYAAKGLPAPKGMRLIPGYKKITISCDSTYKMPIDKQGTPVTFNLYWADTLNGQKLSWHWAKSVNVISGVTLPYTMSGLEINHVYCFALVVVDGEFQGDLTSILNTKTLNLSPPDSFRVTSTGFKQLTLLWKSVDSADSYNVYWSTTESVTKSSEKISTASTSFAHTGLTMGTRYYYCVASVDGNYESQLSAVRLGMVNALTSPTVTLKAGLTSVELSWNSVANAVSYNVYRSQTNDISTSSEKFSCTGTDTVQVNLAPQTQYYYAVSSVNGADESGLSKISSIVTNKLLPPDSINISGDYRSIHITWNNSRDVGTCNVYYSENQDVNTMSNRIPVTGDSVYLTGLLPRKTYYIRISSVKDTYESALSLETPVTTGCLNSPYPITYTIGYGQISLSWTGTPYAQSYIIAWSDTNQTIGPVDSVTVTDTFFSQTDLKPSKNYWFTVIAAKGMDRSEPKGTQIIKTDGLVTPTIVTISDVYKGNRISWTRVPYATSYTLYWSDSTLTGIKHSITTAETFYTHVDLVPDKIYYYWVTGDRGNDESALSTAGSGKPGGLIPPSLNLTISESAVRISAVASKYADFMYVYWSYEDNVTIESESLIKQKNSDYLHAFDSSLDNGKTRYYRAVEVRGGENGEMSVTKSIKLGD